MPDKELIEAVLKMSYLDWVHFSCAVNKTFESIEKHARRDLKIQNPKDLEYWLKEFDF